MRNATRYLAAGFVFGMTSLLSPIASAGVVSFGDGVFNLISASGTGEAIIFSEVTDGATIRFEATNNLVGADRFLGMQAGNIINGLQLAGGGGSTTQFTLSSNLLVTLDSYTTSSTGFFLGAPVMNVTGSGVNSTGNLINAQNINAAFASGPLTLQPNELYTVDIVPSTAGTQAFVSSFTFTVAAVPEPSTMGILTLACGAGCFYHRRKKSAIRK